MKVEALTQLDQKHARELWKKYQTHRVYQSPADAEIAAIYKRLAQGKTVIRALDSIRSAGPEVFGLRALTWTQALWLSLLCGFLFKSNTSSKSTS